MGAASWGRVRAVEVCLPSTASGIDTSGSATHRLRRQHHKVNAGTLTGLCAAHASFRNVFQLRSQGTGWLRALGGKTTQPNTFATPPVHLRRQQQRGIALFVIVFVCSRSNALWASRTSLFNGWWWAATPPTINAFEAAGPAAGRRTRHPRRERQRQRHRRWLICRTSTRQDPLEMKRGPPAGDAGSGDHQVSQRPVRQTHGQSRTSGTTPTCFQGPLAPNGNQRRGRPLQQYTGAANTTTDGPINPILLAGHQFSTYPKAAGTGSKCCPGEQQRFRTDRGRPQQPAAAPA